jgi:GT2 family glycosyltransferase
LKKYDFIKIIEWNDKTFNYSKINNFSVNYAGGEILLFLNNDVEVINSDWLERMLEHVIRKETGAVGAKLYYPDNTIQHAGVIVGIGGVAGHSHKYFPDGSYGYFGRLKIIQNLSAVTAACLMIRKEVFNEVGGFDERYPLAFNDVDFCLKIREKGYLNVWTPYSELYHHESKTRGYEDTREKKERFKVEIKTFKEKWKDFLSKGDPFYNTNLTLEREDFSIGI